MEHKRQTQKESPALSSVISAAREVVIGFVQLISRTLSRSKENRDYTIAAPNEDLAPSSTTADKRKGEQKCGTSKTSHKNQRKTGKKMKKKGK
jgi:hypothetical protein